MNFLCQSVRKLSVDRQTGPKLYTTPLRGWSKMFSVSKKLSPIGDTICLRSLVVVNYWQMAEQVEMKWMKLH